MAILLHLNKDLAKFFHRKKSVDTRIVSAIVGDPERGC